MSLNLALGIVAAIVVVGGGAYVAVNPEVISNFTGGAEDTDENVEENEDEGASVGSTFAAIVALGQSVQCTFSHDDGAGNTSSGTFYMTGGAQQIRGDFTARASDSTPTDGHLLRTQGYTYIWSDSSPQGIKTQVVNEGELTAENQDGGIDEDTEFSCQAWNVDTAKFSLPSGVEFIDMSAQIDAAVNASGSASVKAQQCASCNMLPAGAKEQCLAALAC